MRASFEQTSRTVHEAGERHDGVAKTRKLNTGVIVLDLVMPVTYLLFSFICCFHWPN